ncbi:MULTISPECIES: TetR/AcrR family transcriptional regulator [unclassified Sphingomonas]|uniref:TetR/AcrR family transcriptional regulator n=1 Tax=unclassified Sphingomonas TaxID=196159 RepID=UPI001F56C1B4|nr:MULTISPECIES: TetR/AcrR family transcriptional regulator [unclassified Sphingomonas]
MLVAAEKLMIRCGNDDFTLAEVAKAGRVSIGSIYLRFNSKDDLIRAVHMSVLARVDSEQREMLQTVREQSDNLESFVSNIVEAYAESLRRYAAVLRPMMLRASYDQKLSGVGKASADRIGLLIQREMLCYRDAIGAERPERAVSSAYRVIYATIARYLGFGSSQEVSDEGDWTELKEDLGRMCAAFLARRPD